VTDRALSEQRCLLVINTIRLTSRTFHERRRRHEHSDHKTPRRRVDVAEVAVVAHCCSDRCAKYTVVSVPVFLSFLEYPN
jgi:hypothetical protein